MGEVGWLVFQDKLFSKFKRESASSKVIFVSLFPRALHGPFPSETHQ